MKENTIFELLITDENTDEGVDLISFVEHPAIEENFFYFSKEKEVELYKFNTEGDKFIVTGPAMIPNQKIVRLNSMGLPYQVFFSEETINKCNELFFKRNRQNESNVNHEDATIKGVTVMESWIIEDSKLDKSIALGFEPFPKGTWMISYKVDNKELWSKIKAGEVKGFSIEGFFNLEEVNMEEEVEDDYTLIENIITDDTLTEEEMYDKIQELLK